MQFESVPLRAFFVLLALLLAAVAARADSKPVMIDGLVKRQQQVTADALRQLPPVERQVTFATDRGPQTATYTGVLLWTLIERAQVDDAAKWGELRHALAVTAADGYLLMVSLGEIDPNFGNAPVMLVYARDGESLPALRLVFPGDKHGARDVRDVVHIEVR